MPDLTGVSHLSLSVRDLHRSLAFYRDVLGAPVMAEPYVNPRFEGRMALVLIGSVGLDLQEHTRNSGDGFEPARTGLDHLAFSAGSMSDLKAWAAELDQAGVRRSPIRERPEGAMFDFEDPDGSSSSSSTSTFRATRR